MNVDDEVNRLLDELIEYWSTESSNLIKLSSTPVSAFTRPDRADDFARPRLTRLKELCPSQRWDVRPLLYERRKSRRNQLYEQAREIQAERDARERREQEEREAQEARIRAQEQERYERLRRQFHRRMEHDFLEGAAEYVQELPEGLTTYAWNQLKVEFIQAWSRRNSKGQPPDDQQAGAIGSLHAHTLVTARAGSGKTSTLVNRAAFLVKHCGVPADQLLMLAFNRDAAQQMQRRLSEMNCACPHVMTFHALAYALVHPTEALIYDAPDDNLRRQSRTIQHVINDFVDSDQHRDEVRTIMLARFREDWVRFTFKGLDKSMREGLDFRRSLVGETLAGE